jgi:hypothetical protein
VFLRGKAFGLLEQGVGNLYGCLHMARCITVHVKIASPFEGRDATNQRRCLADSPATRCLVRK